MNFYSHHIGDYKSATAHLTWEQDLAYRRMMEIYYVSEQPLPLDRKRLYRLVLCQTAKHRQAVDDVLEEYFQQHSDGWRHRRCDAEINAAASKRDKARQSASLRWGTGNAMQTQSEGNANASGNDMRTHSEGNAPNPNPNPNPKSIGEVVTRARDPDADLEAKLREAAGWQSHPSPTLAVTGPIHALIAAGADLDLDVLPVIRSLAPKVDSPTTWNYFTKAIARARDRRIEAATIVSPVSSTTEDRHGSQRSRRRRTPGQAMQDAFDDINDRIAAGRGPVAGPGQHDGT